MITNYFKRSSPRESTVNFLINSVHYKIPPHLEYVTASAYLVERLAPFLTCSGQSVIGKSQIRSETHISHFSRKVFKSLSKISNPPFFLKSQIFQAKSEIRSQNLSWKQMPKQVFNRKSTQLYLMHYILGIQSHASCSHRTRIISITQLMQCSFDVELYLKQKYFDGSCTEPCCVHAYNSATDPEKFPAIEIFLKSNRKYFKSNLKSNHFLNRIFIVHIELPNVFKSRFKSRSRLGFAQHWPVVCFFCASLYLEQSNLIYLFVDVPFSLQLAMCL